MSAQHDEKLSLGTKNGGVGLWRAAPRDVDRYEE